MEKDLIKYLKYYLYLGTEENSNAKFLNGEEKDKRIKLAKIIILFFESILGLFVLAYLPILINRLLGDCR